MSLKPKNIEDLKREGFEHASAFIEHTKKTLEFALGIKGAHGLKMIMDINDALSKVIEKNNEWINKINGRISEGYMARTTSYDGTFQ